MRRLPPAQGLPMQILYASFDPVQAPKGASTHIAHFVRALAPQVGSVKLMTLPPSPGFGVLDGDSIEHATVDAKEANFLDRSMAFRDAVADELANHAYDVLHVRSIWEGIPAALAAKRTGARLVYEVNGLPSIELKYHYPGVGENGSLLAKLREQEAFLAREADLLVTPSCVTRDALVTMGANPERIEVIPNGVDVELFKPLWTETAGATLRVLYLGTLAPWQGIDTLFSAIKKAARDIDISLTVVGSGRRSWLKHYTKLARRMHIANHVEFVPQVPHEQVSQTIAQADVCVAPLTRTDRNTKQGCCPIKILEYMACAKPVVASRLPVVRELIDDERTGVLFKPNNANHLCHKLLALAESPELRERLAAAARQEVVERFTWEKACRQLVDAYRRLMGHR